MSSEEYQWKDENIRKEFACLAIILEDCENMRISEQSKEGNRMASRYTVGMEQIKPKRKWLRFTMSSLLIFTVLMAIAAWFFLSPLPVEYHSSGVAMEHFVSNDNIDPQQSRPLLIGHWRIDPTNSIPLPNGTIEEQKIDYSDSDGDGRIDCRSQWRRAAFGEEEVIISEDLDRDGFFDTEKRMYLGLNSIIRQREWTKQIHIPVPKTTP